MTALAFSLEPRSERPVPANRPLPLDDPGTAWIVVRGNVQVFALRRDTDAAAREPLFTVGLGEVVLPPPQDSALALLVVGLEDDTVVGSLPLAELEAGSADGASPEVVQIVESWLDALTAALDDPHPAEDGVSLVADEPAEIAAGADAWPATRLVWVPSSGDLRLFGEHTAADVLLPLPPQAWVRSTAATTVVPVAGAEALGTSIGWAGITAFHAAYFERLRRRLEQQAQAAVDSLERRRAYEDELRTVTYTGLGAVLGGELPRVKPGAEGGTVLAALQLVGEAGGMEIEPPPRGAVGATVDPVDAIARASGVRARKVLFEGAWWKVDVGPVLAWLKADDTPVAVLPRKPNGYEIVDPTDGTRTPIDEESAKTLSGDGYMLYRSLPAHPLTGRDVLRFMLRPLWPDLRRLSLFALLAAGLSLLTPIVTKEIFSHAVPELQRSNLVWLTMLLVLFAIATFTFALAQQIAFLRLQGRGSTDVQAAFWDRLLDLPLPFFRQHSAASLAMNVMGVEQIRLLATSVVVTAVLAIPIGVANLVLAFVLNFRLGLFGAIALLIVAIVMGLLIRYQVPRQRLVQDASNDLFGISLSLVDAVGKLRVADASRRGFAEWGSRFTNLKRRFYEAQLGFAGVTAFTATAPALGTLLIIVGGATLAHGSLSGATFLAFNTAFIQALTAITGLTVVATFMAQAVPLWENTQPILLSERETDVIKSDPGELRGHIEMNHVNFRYADDGPLVLDDVSFTAEPGEFVAFVGPSGAGKSSVMRILLGFELPEVGTVRYDGKDLDSLDPRALRRQMGVVTQSARLMAGDIFTNIVGARPLSVEDAWEAAEIAGVKADIEALPMGMHTHVSEGAGTFSGGQRQRLLIARAVVGRPRILLFDEATSALDNKTQAAVSEAIERLRATRIVIAHRLSTVRAADKIVVLQAGKIVQQGRYDELIELDGPFRRLALRQLA
jgi:NHLM bacteriocin system ABC transporter ATP-binding protein